MPRSPSHIPRLPRAGRSRVIAMLPLAASLALTAPAAGAHELPVGDGHVTSHPAKGNVYACQTHFRGGGAEHTGSWFHGDTWDPDAKPHVSGRVMWPNARFDVSMSGDSLVVRGNGLPVGQPTGTFPISRNDVAYKYDRNPNSIRAQNMSFHIPAEPVRASQPGCLPMGMIGVTKTGVALYNALDDGGRDAAAHEIQDVCDGHPQMRGQYHYHSGSPCIPGASGNSLVGWALDGYPILGMRDASGGLITNAELDACHGRAESVTVEGRRYDYAYRLTQEYPYIMGCFTGETATTTQSIRASAGRQRNMRQPLGRLRPPPGRRPPRP